jgi:uncharacterized membrane protein YoaK (UPF0700 family)
VTRRPQIDHRTNPDLDKHQRERQFEPAIISEVVFAQPDDKGGAGIADWGGSSRCSWRAGERGAGKQLGSDGVNAAGRDSDTATSDRQRGLLLAMLLAGLAGMVDAIGFIRLQHLFVSYMSGNSTQFAVAVGRGRFGEAAPILVLIALFVLGAAGGQLIAHITGRRHLTAVLAVVGALLAAAAVLDTAPVPMVLAMGALNAAMHRAGHLSVSLTFVTGTLVRFGQGLGDLIAGRAEGWGWVEQALPWLGLVAGAIAAGAVYIRIGSAVAWMPVAASGALFVWSLAIPAPE